MDGVPRISTASGLPLPITELLLQNEWKRHVREIPEERQEVIQLLQKIITDVVWPQSHHLPGVAPANAPIYILFNMFVPWAQEATENLHINTHLFYISPTATLSVDLVSRQLVHEGRLPITRETCDMVFSDIPRLPPTRALDLPGPYLNPSMYEWMRKYHLKFLHANIILIRKAGA